MSRVSIFTPLSRPQTMVLVEHAVQKLETLIDSSSDSDLISQAVVSKLMIPVEPLSPASLIQSSDCVW